MVESTLERVMEKINHAKRIKFRGNVYSDKTPVQAAPVMQQRQRM